MQEEVTKVKKLNSELLKELDDISDENKQDNLENRKKLEKAHERENKLKEDIGANTKFNTAMTGRGHPFVLHPARCAISL
jgi:hypothetical protein